MKWFLTLKTDWPSCISRLGHMENTPHKWLFDMISFVPGWILPLEPQLSSLMSLMGCRKIFIVLSGIENWLSYAIFNSIKRLGSIDFAIKKWLFDKKNILFLLEFFLVSPQNLLYHPCDLKSIWVPWTLTSKFVLMFLISKWWFYSLYMLLMSFLL